MCFDVSIEEGKYSTSDILRESSVGNMKDDYFSIDNSDIMSVEFIITETVRLFDNTTYTVVCSECKRKPSATQEFYEEFATNLERISPTVNEYILRLLGVADEEKEYTDEIPREIAIPFEHVMEHIGKYQKDCSIFTARSIVSDLNPRVYAMICNEKDDAFLKRLQEIDSDLYYKVITVLYFDEEDTTPHEVYVANAKSGDLLSGKPGQFYYKPSQ